MNEDVLNKCLIDEKIKIVDAMQILDKNAGGVLFVVDSDNRLKGSLSDGDIRRWIISTGDTQSSVTQAMKKNPVFLFDDEGEDLDECIQKKQIPSVPIVNREFEIVDVYYPIKKGLFSKKTNKTLKDIPAVIMAGGKGTRLYPYTKILPKPLIPIDGVPILERILDRFQGYGVDKFYITVNYRKEMIKSYFNEVEHTYEIIYVEEDKPMGTAGSLKLIKEKFDSPIIVTNCDILIQTEYDKVIKQHIESGVDMTVVSSVKNTRIPYGVLHIGKDGIITSVEEKPIYSDLINTGMYIVNPEVIDLIPGGEMFHMTDLMEILMREERSIGLFPISENSFLDMGEFEEMKHMEEVLTGL